MSRGKSGSDDTVNRRRFLQAATATGAAAVSMSGVASASDRKRIESVDVDGEFTDAAFRAHATDLLDALADEGLLDRGEVTELPTRQTATLRDVAQGKPGTVRVQTADDPDRLVTATDVEGGTLKVAVEPENGRAFAHYEADGAETPVRYDLEDDAFGEEVDPESCMCTYTTCVGYMLIALCNSMPTCGC